MAQKCSLKQCPEFQGGARDNSDLEHRINSCFKTLADNNATFDTGQQAMLMMMHRIFVELKVTFACDFVLKKIIEQKCQIYFMFQNVLQFITTRMANEDEASEKQNEWKFAAMAIDRMCLWLFSIFISGSTCYIFFTAPYLTA